MFKLIMHFDGFGFWGLSLLIFLSCFLITGTAFSEEALDEVSAKALIQEALDSCKNKDYLDSESEVSASDSDMINLPMAQLKANQLKSAFANDRKLFESARSLSYDFRKKKDYASAAGLCDFMISNFPGSEGEVMFNSELIKLHLAQGKSSEASSLADSFLADFKASPVFVESAYELCMPFRHNKNDGKALKIYDELLTGFPEHKLAVNIHASKISTYVWSGRKDQAEAEVETFFTNYSDRSNFVQTAYDMCMWFRKMRNHGQAIRIYDKLLTRFPDHKLAMRIHSSKVSTYVWWTDMPRAEAEAEAFFAAHSRRPGFILRACDMAMWFRRMKNPRQAFRMYGDLLSRFPSDPMAARVLAARIGTSLEMEDQEQVEAGVETLLSEYLSNPDYLKFKPDIRLAENLSKLADSLSKEGYCFLAAGIYRQISLNWPNDKYAVWSDSKIILSNIGRDDYSGFDSDVHYLLEVYKDHKELPDVIHMLGEECLKSGKYDKASYFYSYAVDSWFDHKAAPMSQAGLVEVSWRLKDNTAADKAVDDLFLFSEHKDFQTVVLRLSRRLRSAGENPAATAVISRYLTENPGKKNDPKFLRELAFNNMALGDFAGVDACIADYMQFVSDEGLVLNDSNATAFASDPNTPVFSEVITKDTAPSVKSSMDPAKELFPVLETYFKQASKEVSSDRSLAKQKFQKAIELGRVIDETLPASGVDWLNPEVCLMTAESFRHNGDYRQAIRYLEKMIRKWPDSRFSSQGKFVLQDCRKRLRSGR